jgi:predicted nucleotidyltransferase
MSLADLIESRREEILEIARRNGADNLRVFGSVARGEDDEASDVDFLCDMQPGRSLLDLARLELQLAEALERKVDVVTERGLRPRIRTTVLMEARPL